MGGLNEIVCVDKQSLGGPKVLYLEALRGSKPVGQEQWHQDQAREDPCELEQWVSTPFIFWVVFPHNNTVI